MVASRSAVLVITSFLLLTAAPGVLGTPSSSPTVDVLQPGHHHVCGTDSNGQGAGGTCEDNRSLTLVHAAAAGAFVNVTFHRNRTVAWDTQNGPYTLDDHRTSLTVRSFAPTPVGSAHGNVTVANRTRDSAEDSSGSSATSHEEGVRVGQNVGVVLQLPVPGWQRTAVNAKGAQVGTVVIHHDGDVCTVTVTVDGTSPPDLPCPSSAVPGAPAILP